MIIRNCRVSLNWGFCFVYEILLWPIRVCGRTAIDKFCFSQLESVVEQQSTTCRCICQKNIFPVMQFSQIGQHSEQLLGAKLKIQFRQQEQSDI